MRPNENLEKLLSEDLTFQASPELRERLWATIQTAQAETTKNPPARLALWRVIMNSKITRVAAALLLLAGLVTLSWLSQKGTSNPASYTSTFNLLSVATAAEASVFYQSENVQYVVNEIILYPQTGPSLPERLESFKADPTRTGEMALLSSYLHSAKLPMLVLEANGGLTLVDLELPQDASEPVTITMEVWYDHATRRFIRLAKRADNVLFAHAFDGEAVYRSHTDNGVLSITRTPVTSAFEAPANPVDFLGLATGFKISTRQDHYPPIQRVTEEVIDNGTAVRVYQLGFENINDQLDTYYLFKQNRDNEVLEEIVCVEDDQTVSRHRRVHNEVVDRPTVGWDLSELQEDQAATSEITTTEMNFKALTPADVVAKFEFETSLFTERPAWTQAEVLAEIPDAMNPMQTMLGIIYYAEDGRNMVMSQSVTFHQYMVASLSKPDLEGRGFPWHYTSQRGFRVHRHTSDGGCAWWTKIAIQGCGFEPVDEREGFFFQTPNGFYFPLAVNGPVSEAEMKQLTDSLMLAKELVSSQNTQ